MGLEIGQRVRGAFGVTYTVEAKIGQGGTAVVWRLVDREGARWAAKVLSGHRFEVDSAMRARFDREIGVLRSVAHQNVLAVRDEAEASGGRVLITELAACSLFDWLEARDRAVPLPIALGFIDQALAGVAALHHRGFVHRDLSPKNLMIREDGSLLVADFGTVRHLGDETLTSNRDQIGSLIYISSDQFDDAHSACPQDDVFSLGQIAWELLAGVRPTGNPASIHEVRSDLPPGLGELIEAMRSNDRDIRPSSASSARRRFRDCLGVRQRRDCLSGTDEIETTLDAIAARQLRAAHHLRKSSDDANLASTLEELVAVLGPVRLSLEGPANEQGLEWPDWFAASPEAAGALFGGSLQWGSERLTGPEDVHLATVTNPITGLTATQATNGLVCLPSLDIRNLLQAFKSPELGRDSERSKTLRRAFTSSAFVLGRPCRDCGEPLELQQPSRTGRWATFRGTLFRAAVCPNDPRDSVLRCCVCGTTFRIVGGSDEWGSYDATGCECTRSLDLEYHESPWLDGEMLTEEQVPTIYEN
jgi:serine/threonine protein kinase